jgi:hypothetical protein
MSATTTATRTMSTTVHPQKDASYIPRGPVEAELTFYSPPADGSNPYNYVEKPPAGLPQRNFGSDVRKVLISDLRGHESEHTLDVSAFQALTAEQVGSSAATYETFNNEDEIKRIYYPEVEQLLLKHVPGAHKIVIFDHTIRRSNPDAARGPVTRVHIDQTPASAEQRVYHHLPSAEATELVQNRYRIINVWRPLNQRPVQSNPLAFAASNTVPDEDLVAVEHRYPNRTGETAGVKYNPEHKWYYWSGMTFDERVLLKCVDSLEGVVGQRVPHTAFVDPRTPEGAEGRESIEVRALVFG